MHRVTRPGGRIGIYVWDYAEGMQLMRHFWDTAIEQDPAVADKAESLQFAICAPDPLQAAFADAGLPGATVEPIDMATVFRDFDASGRRVQPRGASPPMRSEPDRADLRERLRARLPVEDDGRSA